MRFSSCWCFMLLIDETFTNSRLLRVWYLRGNGAVHRRRLHRNQLAPSLCQGHSARRQLGPYRQRHGSGDEHARSGSGSLPLAPQFTLPATHCSSETRLRLGMTHPALRAPFPRGDLYLTIASYNSPLLGGVPKGRGGFDPPWETLHPAVSSR